MQRSRTDPMDDRHGDGSSSDRKLWGGERLGLAPHGMPGASCSRWGKARYRPPPHVAGGSPCGHLHQQDDGNPQQRKSFCVTSRPTLGGECLDLPERTGHNHFKKDRCNQLKGNTSRKRSRPTGQLQRGVQDHGKRRISRRRKTNEESP